ncbi:MAG: alpha/beta hydrolase [Hyphomicrobiaceae bacterium]|nr:MAG: alpha/beta hydrolase [Hyphomicrobiaceae bacterium]
MLAAVMRAVVQGLLALALAALAGCSFSPADQETDSSDGRRTRVAVAGKPITLYSEEGGLGDTLLLLHGYGSSTYSWRFLKAELQRTHHVIALDLKGFGRSEKPRDEAYGVEDQAKIVAAFIQERGLQRVTLIGHSYGGSIALAVALRFNATEQKRIRSLVLLDSPAFPQGLPVALRVLRTPYLADVTVASILPEAAAAGALALAYRDPTRITSADVAAYARPLYDPGTRHALIKTAEQLVPGNLEELTARYKSIRQPALVIWCREDKIVPLRVGFQLVANLPNSRLEVLETCGHLPQEEAAEATLALLKRFLAAR